MLLIWAIACAALIVIETMTLDFTFLMLALGCLVGLALAALGASFFLQCLAVALTAVVGFVLIAPTLRRRLTPRDTPSANQAMIGSEALVIDAIRPPAQGRVKIDGVIWQALSNRDIPEGTTVIVTELEGNRLTVLARGEVLPTRAISQPLLSPMASTQPPVGAADAPTPPPPQQDLL